MLNCDGCLWRLPDTCRACRVDQSIKIAEQIGTVSLTRLHKLTLSQKIRRFIRGY